MKTLADEIETLVRNTGLNIKQAVITNLPVQNYHDDLLKIVTHPINGTTILNSNYTGDDFDRFWTSLDKVRINNLLYHRYTGIIWLDDNLTWIERLHITPIVQWETKRIPLFPIFRKRGNRV